MKHTRPGKQFAIQNGPVEIVDLPMKNGGSFHRFVLMFTISGTPYLSHDIHHHYPIIYTIIPCILLSYYIYIIYTIYHDIYIYIYYPIIYII